MDQQESEGKNTKRRAAWLDDPAALAQFDSAALRWGRWANVMVADVPALRLLQSALPSDISVELRQRLMYLAFDIKVAYANTSYHINELAGTENEYLVRYDERRRFRPFHDEKSFHIAMMRSRAAFALISRVRALWDKLFLYVVLRFDGEDAARKLQSRRSKRKFFFARYAAGIGRISQETMGASLADINKLERNYRSPELHGFGVVPPWVFESPTTWPYGHTSPILGHWSTMQTFLTAAFAEANGKECSLDPVDGRGPSEREQPGT